MRESYDIRDSHSTYKTVNYHYKSISYHFRDRNDGCTHTS